MSNGWDTSAAAWVEALGEHGDFGRRFVLDPVMLPRALAAGAQTALDVGCGEGRFCRMLQGHGLRVTGLDPTASLIALARARDPDGTYVEGAAEALPFPDAAFDLVVSYLSLINIEDIARAIPEMSRVLKPGGRLLVANLTSFNTAGTDLDWTLDAAGQRVSWPVDRYLTPRANWVAWRGIRVINHHRPLSTYMRLFLEQGLVLSHFDEPAPTADAPEARARDYVRAPWFLVMEWMRPRR
jgi:SAM-dependent methyltransferase